MIFITGDTHGREDIMKLSNKLKMHISYVLEDGANNAGN